jgi:hypothetical protein
LACLRENEAIEQVREGQPRGLTGIAKNKEETVTAVWQVEVTLSVSETTPLTPHGRKTPRARH